MNAESNKIESALPIRFDVVYESGRCTIAPHFCREWTIDASGAEVGCYGTNPEHGMSFDAACGHVADWYEQQASLWRNAEHHDCLHYTKDRQ